jgi:hypothetical protein
MSILLWCLKFWGGLTTDPKIDKVEQRNLKTHFDVTVKFRVNGYVNVQLVSSSGGWGRLTRRRGCHLS